MNSDPWGVPDIADTVRLAAIIHPFELSTLRKLHPLHLKPIDSSGLRQLEPVLSENYIRHY